VDGIPQTLDILTVGGVPALLTCRGPIRLVIHGYSAGGSEGVAGTEGREGRAGTGHLEQRRLGRASKRKAEDGSVRGPYGGRFVFYTDPSLSTHLPLQPQRVHYRSQAVQSILRFSASADSSHDGGPVSAKAPCPFCGRDDVRLSSEHWLPRGWADYINVPTLLVDSFITDRGAEPETWEKRRSPFTTQAGGICIECNNGWMREIDERAKAPFLDLALGLTSRLPGRQTLAFSASMFRAALVYAWSQRTKHPNGPLDRLPGFCRDRRPGEHDYVLIARANEPWIFAGGTCTVLTATEYNQGVVSVFAWGVEDFMVFVITSHPGMERFADLLAKRMKRHSQGAVKQVWPSDGRTAVVVDGRLMDRGLADYIAQSAPLLFGRLPAERIRDTPRAEQLWKAKPPEHFWERATRPWPEDANT